MTRTTLANNPHIYEACLNHKEGNTEPNIPCTTTATCYVTSGNQQNKTMNDYDAQNIVLLKTQPFKIPYNTKDDWESKPCTLTLDPH